MAAERMKRSKREATKSKRSEAVDACTSRQDLAIVKFAVSIAKSATMPPGLVWVFGLPELVYVLFVLIVCCVCVDLRVADR